MSEAEIEDIVCDEEELEEYFELPESVNVTQVVDTLCDVDISRLLDELEEELDWGTLVDSVCYSCIAGFATPWAIKTKSPVTDFTISCQ